MAGLKTLLGDKYKEGMTIEELLDMDVDMSNYVSKDTYNKVSSEAADYKKQLRASKSEAELKALEEAERIANLEAENKQLKVDKMIAEKTKAFVAMGYDEKSATEVAKALLEGDTDTVIKMQASFVDAQKKAAIAAEVMKMPTPPASSGKDGSVVTQEQFDAMGYTDRLSLFNENPELYKELSGGK